MDIGAAIDKVTPILNSDLGSNCSFGFLGKNTHRAFHKQICYASLKHKLKGEDFYYTTITPNKDPSRFDEIYDWTEWLLSEEGPWKNLMKDRNRAIIVADDAVCGYILEVKDDDDAHLLKNLSIAGRIPGEYHTTFRAINCIVSEGMSRSEAFYIGHHLRCREDGVINLSNSFTNHMIISEPRNFNLKRFLSGDPHKSSAKLGESFSSYYGDVNGRFDQTKFMKTRLTDKVSTQTVKGRWSVAPAHVNIRDVLDVWPAYKEQSIALAN